MSIKEKLESMRRNSIVLKIAKKEKYIKCATRFGGQPDVPSDFVWPTFEGESYDGVVKDCPLTFIAQFNCADLAPGEYGIWLPASMGELSAMGGSGTGIQESGIMYWIF